MKLMTAAAIAALAVAPSSGWAASFVNGGFESGDATGWTQNGTYRGSLNNTQLAAATISSTTNRSGAVAAGTVDPTIGAAFGSTVYAGNYSFRVEDTTYGGYASVLTQTVTNYTDANIFFVWKAVLEGAHGVNDAATMIIKLTDLTSGLDLITRTYNAASTGSGIDPRFSYQSGYYYTADWQIEQLAIDSSLSGHDFMLSILAADCQPTGHLGYVYVDGFGSVQGGTGDPNDPTGAVPEPATWAMMIAGFGLAGAAMRRRRGAVSFA